MSKKLKVATVGTGYFSQFHYDAWKRCDDVEIVGVADLNETSAKRIAGDFSAPAFSSVRQMLEQTSPDLLDVITPPQTHKEMITLAAEHDVNVICQKPFCESLDQAKEMLKVANGIDVTVHENFRFQPWYSILKQQIPRLGELYRATFRLRPGDGQGPDAYLERQPYFQTMERFLVHETVVHNIDVFRYLLGEPTRVFADLQKLNPVISGEDACLILLDFGSARGTIDGNRLSDHKAENCRRTMGEMIIEGANGVLELDGDAAIKFRPHGSNDIEQVPYQWNDHGFGGDCVFHFTRHIVDHYLYEKPRMNSAKDYIRNLEIEEAVYTSSEEGRWISI